MVRRRLGARPQWPVTEGDAITALQAAGLRVVAVDVDSSFGDGLDAAVHAVDASGNQSASVSCLVLPPPK